MIEEKIEHFFEEIVSHVQNNGKDFNSIISELNHILNKTDPDIINRRKAAYKYVQSGFYKNEKAILRKLKEKFGKKKIPDLRFIADKICEKEKIPLPQSTRKNKDSLLQWFDDHWEVIEHHSFD